MAIIDGPADQATHHANFMLTLYTLGLWDGGDADISYGNHRILIEMDGDGNISVHEGTLRTPRVYRWIV